MDKSRDDVFNLIKFVGFEYIKQKGVVQMWELIKGDEKYTFIYNTSSYYYDLSESTRGLTFKSLVYTKNSNISYDTIRELFKHEYRQYIVKKLLKNNENI